MNTSTFHSNLRQPAKIAPLHSLSLASELHPIGFFLVLAMIFIIFVSNGKPMWTSSAIHSCAISMILIALRGPKHLFDLAFSARNRIMTSILVAYFCTDFISVLVNLNEFTTLTIVLRSLIPLMVYFSLIGLTLDRQKIFLILAAISFASIIIFVRGIIAFYQEWGIPDAETLIWARYDRLRMMTYESATFGNVGNTSVYVIMILPTALFGAIYIYREPMRRALLLTSFALGLINLVISGARAAIFVFFVACLCGAMGGTRMRLIAIRLTLVLSAIFFFLRLLTQVIALENLAGRYIPAYGGKIDNSTIARVESIEIGWETFLEHPIAGVGIEMSRFYNIHYVPHQSFCLILSETGLVGGIIFICLNFYVFFRLFQSLLHFEKGYRQKFEFIALIGPTCWFLFGIIAGISFNADFALVWVGMAYSMLSLASAEHEEDATTLAA